MSGTTAAVHLRNSLTFAYTAMPWPAEPLWLSSWMHLQMASCSWHILPEADAARQVLLPGTHDGLGFCDMEWLLVCPSTLRARLWAGIQLKRWSTLLAPLTIAAMQVAGLVSLSFNVETREQWPTLQPPDTSAYCSNMAVRQDLQR